MKPIHKTKEIIKKLPEQKRHLDFLAALLTIPVLISVLIINYSSLQNKKALGVISPTPTPTQAQAKSVPSAATRVTTITPVTTQSALPTQPLCKSDIGPISIDSPKEGQTVTANPTCIDIAYNGDGYCAVVWAYKINDGALSDYSNNSLCLYNLPQGSNSVSVKVKSLISGKEETLQRSFNFAGTVVTVSPTPTPTSSPVPTPGS